ncbi:GMP synthetase (glutamine aminotransferase) [Desulfamplus magnetovallimortis]|uniref:GMP synthase [glutamine-hydrolyzing] n=1 Tax=Desulfamplus magnetovallimortis TaxID=1246637 RepID=A0A1W1HAM1_9BACT|nr:glutamine-hydrolyzing GMP synthase [Desulfamplus magnetovallimortis]SLM29445.1 GMP synthetase (glutamine aminotransferase) [Desulfamplus magnetovallimortis]
MILIIDFGSQFNQLIARRVRENEVYCQIEPAGFPLEKIAALKPEGIILSGGPSSIYEENSPKIDPGIFELGTPVLGICYGMHLMIHALGGKISRAPKREYGFATLEIRQNEPIFKDMDSRIQCWMSHGDSTDILPSGFTVTASTQNTEFAAIANFDKKFYALQFHPEVEHTVRGTEMIRNFLFDVCGCQKSWNMGSFAAGAIDQIQQSVKDKKVVMGLSGGVDSSVAALLIHKAIGKNLHCIFVDNGLLRKNEKENLEQSLTANLDMNILFVDERRRFLDALKDVTDPEKKRKIIGKLFIDVFEAEAAKIKDAEFLGQGTLYPDIIESKSAFGGPTSIIKSHHNVGGLPEKMNLKLIEPLQLLFKDEVRALGLELGLNEDLVWRQPFPGPGLAIRIMGAVSEERLSILKEADSILLEEIRGAGLYRELWQSFAVLLPVKSVGVMGDKRTYDSCIAIRAVTSKDAMTADWARLPHELLAKISSRIINEVDGVNRVVFDITSKPPGTIEWE